MSAADTAAPADADADTDADADAVRIDVLLPVRDGARWIGDSVESILQQTHRRLRLHVVDDGSRDETPAILRALAAGDRRVCLHASPGGGLVDALNHGLRFCDAPFLARHDADDRAAPHRLEVQLAYLRSNPDCVAVGATARHIDAGGAAIGTLAVLPPPEAADAAWVPAREPYLLHPFLMCRRRALHEAGGYRPVANAEDSDLYWRLSRLGRLHHLAEVLGDYRLHGASVSAASLHGGRLMAVGSQLAALSAQRREGGADDLPFDAARLARLRAASSLEAMLEAAAADLTVGERGAFAHRVAAKLLELADYQPYELDAGDCAFVGGTLERFAQAPLAAANRRSLDRLLTRAAVRLRRGGRRDDAMRLLPARLLLPFLLRFAWEAGVPAALRRRLHAALRPRTAAAPARAA